MNFLKEKGLRHIQYVTYCMSFNSNNKMFIKGFIFIQLIHSFVAFPRNFKPSKSAW